MASFFRTATAESASARKAYSRRQTRWGQRKEKQAEKKSWGQRETGKKPSSRPSLPIPFFFPFFSLLCFAPLWNRLASGLTARSKKIKCFLSRYAMNTKSCRDSRSSLKTSGRWDNTRWRSVQRGFLAPSSIITYCCEFRMVSTFISNIPTLCWAKDRPCESSSCHITFRGNHKE